MMNIVKRAFLFILSVFVLGILFESPVHAIGYANTSADLVIGQPGFNCQVGERNGDIIRSLYTNFSNVLVVGTRLIIPAGNGNRLTIYNTIPTTNYKAPDLILGQKDPCMHPFYYSDAPNDFYLPVNTYFDGTRFYVADRGYHRVAIYNNGVPNTQDEGPDIILGRPDFSNSTTAATPVSAATFNGPYDMWSDGHKIIVSDEANHRVLIWNSIPTTHGTPADVVIGQTDMTTATGGTSATKLSSPRGLDVYEGKLYVADYGNNRVLVYNSIPTTNGVAADVVFGQPDMNSKVVNNGGLSASSLYAPTEVNFSNGKMFIGDRTNNRVLIFNSVPSSNKPSADVVVGQPDFVTNSAGLSASKFGAAYAGYSDGTKFYVTDYTNSRILIYNSIPTTNGAAADVVIGQPDFTTSLTRYGQLPVTGANLSWTGALFYDDGNLYVGDSLGKRILKYSTVPTSNGASADVVIGQPDMVTVSSGTTASKFSSGLGPVARSGNKLLIVDSSRILIFNSIPTTNGASADLVIGQPNLTSNTTNNGGLSAKSLYWAYGMIVADSKLIVSDSNNNRVLIWNSIPTANFVSADVVIGQPNFTSNTANNGGVSASSLATPQGLAYINGRLVISDSVNNRVLIYNSIPTTNGAAANVVIGQPDLITNEINNGGRSAKSLNYPQGLFVDGTRLYIADFRNHRVLIYTNIPSNNFASADAVIGQPNMTQAIRSSLATGLNSPKQVIVSPTKLLIGDYYSSRVLGYPLGPQNTSVAGGGLFTPANASITLAAEDAKEVMISEDPGFSGATWSSFATTKSVTVASGDGAKTLYVKMRDYANYESSVYTTTITIDGTKPSAAVITDIGKITNVPDKTPLYYYFTSTTVKIKGTVEAGTTVHFKYDGKDKTVIADSDGKVSIEITNLPRELTEFTYYTQDAAGNKSDSRILKLMVGEENFPTYLVSSTTPSVTSSPNVTSTPQPTETVIPITTPVTQAITVKDSNGNTLKNTTVYVDGKKYTTDSQGKIQIDPNTAKNAKIEVEVDGKKYDAGVLGQSVVVATAIEKKNSTWLWILLGISGLALVIWLFNRRR